MMRILIIGATSAIAQACARCWAPRGADFFLVARDAERLRSVAQDLSVRGASEVREFAMDANDLPAHAAMCEQAVRSLGRLDIVLIAYGTLPDQAACERDAGLAFGEFSTNCTTVIALLTVLANQFERQRGGAIAVITSVAGDRGRRSNYLYGSAKAAVSVFCDGLRIRLREAGISLTDIRPGFVATPMTHELALPLLLVSRPEDVARRIVSGIERGTDVLYAPAYWRLIMLIVRLIPRTLFERMNL